MFYRLVMLFCFTFIPVLVFAEQNSVEIEISLNQDVLYAGENTSGNIDIINNINKELNLLIDVYALGREGWFSVSKRRVSLESKENTTIPFEIYIPNNVEGGRYYFYVRLEDVNNHILVTKRGSFYVLDRPLLSIRKIGFEYPVIESNKTQMVYVTISNIGEIDANNYRFTIRIPKLGYFKYVKDLSLKKGQEHIYVDEIFIPHDAFPGNYETYVELYDEKNNVVEKKESSFKVRETPLLDVKIKTNENILYKETYYTIMNKGNAKGEYIKEIDTMGFIWIYEFENISPKRKGVVYILKCDIEPNKECRFYVRVNYWVLYVVLIVIITLLILIFIAFTSPKIKKEYYRKGHKYHITLTVINHKAKELKEVVVKDYVKGIFNIDETSILPKPSKIHKSKEGYVIEWRLGTLKPGEMRVLRYDIVPKIDIIGDVTLEKAVLEGKTKRGKKYTTSS